MGKMDKTISFMFLSRVFLLVLSPALSSCAVGSDANSPESPPFFR